MKYAAGMVAKMRLIGFNFNLMGSVEIGGQEIETREIGVDHIMLDYAPLTTGNAPVQLMNGETIATLSVTRESNGGDAPLDEG